jgi:hypothetical protein
VLIWKVNQVKLYGLIVLPALIAKICLSAAS